MLMKRTFTAVVAYEDASTVDRAQKAWDHLICTLQGHSEFGLRLWKFEFLRTPEMRAVAARDAAQADMILIATHGTGELPAEVKAWIDGWLAHKGEVQGDQSTLAVLFDAPPDKVGVPAPAQFAYLQRAARKGNMDFLVSTYDRSGATTGFSRPPLGRMVMLHGR